MSIWRGRARFWTLAWAVVQLAIAPALSFADGMFALRNRTVVAHVEGHSSKACQPPHTADCTVCQSLSSNVSAASAVATFICPVARVLTAPERPHYIATALARNHSLSRAPPVA